MSERGNITHAGQDVRLANIPADAGAGIGLFQNLHEMESPAALATHLREATRRNTFGTPSRASLGHLLRERDDNETGLPPESMRCDRTSSMRFCRQMPMARSSALPAALV